MERIKASFDRTDSLGALDGLSLSGDLEKKVCQGSHVKVEYLKIEPITQTQDKQGRIRVVVVQSKENSAKTLRLVTVTDTGVELRYVVRQ
ncbi:hypothetical protein EVA_07571 [gut metagenome]|uniref:Uncharacterized protein n=1 Tax=gut metagenome TaxID=749906 RepID=J9GBU2_9ZZZZ